MLTADMPLVVMANSLETNATARKCGGCRYQIVILISTVLLATATRSSSTSLRSTKGSPESLLNAFIDLLNLTDFTCDGFEWCTVRKENVGVYLKTTYFYYGGCCASCSCEPTCVLNMNCCPDYTLKPYLNGTTFTNISQLLSAIEKFENVSNLEVARPYSYGNATTSNSNGTDTPPPTKCVSSDMNNLVSKNVHRGSTYHMVGTCSNVNVSLEIIQRCEASHDARIEASRSQTSLVDIRPVQSTESGVVYRNIYCLYCGQDASSNYEKWNAYVADTTIPLQLLMDYPTSYNEVVSYVLNRQSIGSNMVFEPGERIRLRYPPSTCLNVDVDSCIDDGDMQRTLVCQRFSLPLCVWDETSKTNVVYNNVACLYCNNISDVTGKRSICSRYLHSPTNLFLCQLRNELLENVGSNISETEHAGILNKTPSPSQCGVGFVYDKAKDSCKQLHCPCGMVAYKSECTPVFKTIAGRDVDFFVSVTGRGDNPASHLADVHFAMALADYFDEQFKPDVDDVYTDTILVGRSARSRSRAEEYAVYVLLKERAFGFDYLSVVSKIAKVARGAKRIKVGKNDINVQMAVTDSVIFRIHHEDKMIDPLARKEYATIYVRRDKRTRGRASIIQIRSCFFCYRTTLLADDIEVFLLSNVVFIRYLGKNVSMDSLTFISTNTALICFNELVNQPPQSDVDDVEGSLEETTEIPDSIDSIEDGPSAEEHASFVAASVLALILILTCLAKRTCNQTTQ